MSDPAARFASQLLLAPLAALLLGGGVLAGGAAAQEHEYVGYQKCKSCHKKVDIGNQMAAWQESGHAKAYETLAGEKAAKWAKGGRLRSPDRREVREMPHHRLRCAGRHGLQQL